MHQPMRGQLLQNLPLPMKSHPHRPMTQQQLLKCLWHLEQGVIQAKRPWTRETCICHHHLRQRLATMVQSRAQQNQQQVAP